MWFESWPLPEAAQTTLEDIQRAVYGAIERRGVPVADRSRLEDLESHVHITVGFGNIHGTFRLTRPSDEGGGYVSFESDEVFHDWEQAYVFFVDVALALRAQPEPLLESVEERFADESDRSTELRSCILRGIDTVQGWLHPDLSVTRTFAWSSDGPDAEAQLIAFDVDVRFESPRALVVHIAGAGDVFVGRVTIDSSMWLPHHIADLRSFLQAELHPVLFQSAKLRRTVTRPRVDPSRAGGHWLERRDEAGMVVGSAPVVSVEEIEMALEEYDVDVIRYFSNGAPFWRATFEKGKSIDEPDLDALHGYRVWRWTP